METRIRKDIRRVKKRKFGRIEMKIFFAGAENYWFAETLKRCGVNNILLSYPHLSGGNIDGLLPLFKTWKNLKLMVDSGGFSVITRGIEIDIFRYIDFIKNNLEHITYYFVLDNRLEKLKETKRNHRLMRKIGLDPIPIYHIDEPLSYFQGLCRNHKYIGIGGKDKKNIHDLFRIAKMNRTKIHLLGATAPSVIYTYLPYSCDSSTWINSVKFGGLYLFNGFSLTPCHRKRLSDIKQNFILNKKLYSRYNIELKDIVSDYYDKTKLLIFNILNFQLFEKYVNKVDKKI